MDGSGKSGSGGNGQNVFAILGHDISRYILGVFVDANKVSCS